jgi:hypothetical protein
MPLYIRDLLGYLRILEFAGFWSQTPMDIER